MKIALFFVLMSTSLMAHADRDLALINTHVNVMKMYAEFDLSCQTDSDCVVLPTGHKPCGGPSMSVITAKKNPLFSEVKRLARIVTTEQRAYNQANNRFSTCSIMRMPTPVCESLTCR
ncbi:MAG: hypothetical protein ACLGG0_14795 [Bacteriovoracia bacterium]